ncbi:MULTISPECIES: hypothetical protein [Thalassospira]|uniref:Uncharacterized protein n=2 Tax=Thalassospira TaxID=168934 RepID=A0A367W8Y4_9PROT|nr:MULTISPECIES: hypothetical protein [Thalassospira]MDG4718132.1 hypothetical protein [Thalassospira sp. FZY0004]RCK37898.1 hypothetical protein TH19_07705 [Thalassospira profundimaris]
MRKRQSTSVLQTALSAFLGGIITLFFVLTMNILPELDVKIEQWDSKIATLYGWQTLAGAFLALLAAVATVAVINIQTRSARKNFEKSVENAARKSRAFLPLAATEIIEYSNTLITEMENMGQHVLSHAENTTYTNVRSHNFPDLPNEAISRFANATEHEQSPYIQEVLANTIRALQFQRARITRYISQNKVGNSDIESNIKVSLKIIAMCHEIFKHSDKNYWDFNKREKINDALSTSTISGHGVNLQNIIDWIASLKN